MTEQFEVLALRYGRLRTAWTSLYVESIDETTPQQTELAYYYWLAVGAERIVLIDTGFDPIVGDRRGRETLTAPLDLLTETGVSADQVTDVVLTHFHYDHIGNVRAFGNARVYASASEYRHWIGSGVRPGDEAPVEVEELEEIARLYREDRLILLPEGDDVAIVDGITAISLPGHTPGQIAIRIATRGADVVLTSDAAHSAEEIDRDSPFHVFTDLAEMRTSMARVRQMQQEGREVLVLGHEPSVLSSFPSWRGNHQIVRVSP